MKVVPYKVTFPTIPHLLTLMQLARFFAILMLEGKTSAAIKLITGHKCEGLLPLDDHVILPTEAGN